MSKRKKHPQTRTGSTPNFSEGKYGSPPKPPVETLPILGTTWYTRGASYWARRVLIFLAIIIVTAGQGCILYGLIHAITKDSSKSTTFKVIALAVVASCIIVSFAYWTRWFARIERRKRQGEIAYPEYIPRTGETGAFAGGMGNMARTEDSAAGGCVVAATIILAGATPFLIVRTLQKEYVYEHDARLRLEKWKRDHADASSASQ